MARRDEEKARTGRNADRNKQDDRRDVKNATPHGRYGEAPKQAPHLSPEVEPVRGEDAAARPPRTQSGALPENEGENVDDARRPRKE